MTLTSIRARVAAWSALAILAALIGGWPVLGRLLTDFVERRIANELDAVALSVLAAATWTDEATLRVAPPPSDPRFTPPYSGWYWQVDDGATVIARSRSLATSDLGVGALAGVDREGRTLLIHRRRGTAPGSSAVVTVAVTVPQRMVDEELAGLTRPLLSWLVVLAAVLLTGSLLGVTLGQRALVHVQRDLTALRRGDIPALPRPHVAELQPLVEEVNALLADRRAMLERSRLHVGNLAHALKTPLAVLQNRVDDPETLALLTRIERTVRWHLKRARVVGTQEGSGMAAPVEGVLTDVALVLRPEAARRDVTLHLVGAAGVTFAGEREDFAEVVGNLAENAVRWAATRVDVTVERVDHATLRVVVRDDGPGIPPDRRSAALHRGVQLTDRMGGSGLGLAIVSDLVAAYGGSIDLRDAHRDDDRTAGLEVVVTLPAFA